ncbi:hybrid sensor histidine kinase/response regulator [Engelhardtia mirabilis]|uniref:histidine kinase n=1 Tax=Engelhardtia mirabilis TaxID=2528011 RepID=A0A518BQE2_9BACT|nr:Blue-light-activated protein [Planctomycetes bacterium Pla133]QDV03519.1 Blue-light-activated protein [Planctomycetes bacterium Pla86]
MTRGLFTALERHHDLVLGVDAGGRLVHAGPDRPAAGFFLDPPSVGVRLLDVLRVDLRGAIAEGLETARRTGVASVRCRLEGPPREFTLEVSDAGDGLLLLLGRAVGVADPLRGSSSADPKDVLHDVLSRLTQGVVIQGPGAEVLMANPAALELLGLSEAQLLGANSHDPAWRAFHADGRDFPSSDHPVPRAIADRRPVRDVVMGIDRPGELPRIWLSVDAVPVLDTGGEVSHVICSFDDVTQEREARAALEREHALLSEVMNTSVAGIVVLEPSGQIVFANRAAEGILGLEVSSIVGRAYNDPHWRSTDVDGGSIADERLPFAIVMATRRPVVDVRHGIEWADGSRRILSINGAPVINSEGQVERLVFGVLDVTEQVRQVREQVEVQRELESIARLESLSVLAGGVAHDFNNILVGVLTTADLLRAELPSDHPSIGLVEMIEHGGQRAAELTRQLLAFSGRGRFDLESIDLSECIGETSQLLAALVSKDVRIEFDLAPDLPAIAADPTQIRQIAMNVVLNAAQAIGDRAGTVRLRTRFVPDYDAGLTLEGLVEGDPAPPYVALVVDDDGPGIEPAVLQRIFEPFFTTKDRGHGLGLAAVRGAVRSFGGFLHVGNRAGQGAVFSFGFPPAGEALERARAVEPAGIPNLSGTVLVIDDEQVVRRVVSAILRDFGCDVVTAIDGVHGLETFEREAARITAAVVDVNMPRMNGDEVIRKLRDRAPQLPILLMSGRLDRDFEPIDALQEFVAKPFRRADLAQALGRLVRRVPN